MNKEKADAKCICLLICPVYVPDYNYMTYMAGKHGAIHCVVRADDFTRPHIHKGLCVDKRIDIMANKMDSKET